MRKIALQASNGQYMCAEKGGGREVVANRNVIGSWETFTMIKAQNRPYRFYNDQLLFTRVAKLTGLTI